MPGAGSCGTPSHEGHVPLTLPTHFSIANRSVGEGAPCFVIAEAGVNHNGNLDLAERLIDAAADAHADAVKFQTFAPARLVSAGADKAPYQKETTGSGSQRDMLEQLALPTSAWAHLKARAEGRGLVFLSTPFDESSADLLVALGVPALKIGSGELTNHLLLSHVAAAGVPLLISTGMATMDEVRAGVTVASAQGAPVAILHCVSSYPAQARDCNLTAMSTMHDELGCPVGFSDHTLGNTVAVAAVAMGAKLVEKHLTVDRTLAGPDHRASLEPREFTALVSAVREVEAARGDGKKRPMACEEDVRRVARRSLFWARPVVAGAVVERADLDALRPATGLPPSCFHEIVGRRAARAVAAGQMVSPGDLLQ